MHRHILVAKLFPSYAYDNVYGSPLQSCSQEGMALTGYTRTGYCVDQYDDSGSHHICIDMSSLTNNNDDGGGDFCQVTGQSDWCSSEMPCHEDKNDYCPVQNWCVCQWAFAAYIQKAGGCDEIQDIVCESVNLEALKSYYKRSESKYRDALACVTERCGVRKSVYASASFGAKTVGSVAGIGLLVASVLVGMIICNRRRKSNSPLLKEQLVNDVDKNYGSSTSIKTKEII